MSKSLYDGIVSSDRICYYRNREFANDESPQSLAKKEKIHILFAHFPSDPS